MKYSYYESLWVTADYDDEKGGDRIECDLSVFVDDEEIDKTVDELGGNPYPKELVETILKRHIDDKIALIHKVIERVELYRKDKKLHIEIHNKYNSDVEEITLVRKWRNWVIEK